MRLIVAGVIPWPAAVTFSRKACAATGRPFPEDLGPLRSENYPRAISFYSEKYSSEKDPAKKDYYKENLDFFASVYGLKDAKLRERREWAIALTAIGPYRKRLAGELTG